MRYSSAPDRIRVLWLIKGLGPGGAEQLLVSSARVADHDRFRYTTAYVREDKGHLAPMLQANGVTTTLLRGGTRQWVPRLRSLMGQADIVHSHSPLLASIARALARTIPRARRPITVSTEHNVWGNFSTPTRLVNALTAPLDQHRWAVSTPVRESMWPPIRSGAEVLTHGIVLTDRPSEQDPVATRRALGLPDDAIVVITVANLRPEKDYRNLLRAAAIAIERDPRVHLIAVGQGPLEAQIAEEHRRLGLANRVQLLGYRTDVPQLLAASDIFVLASRTEGLPVAIMEAMAQGLPVVATAVGGVPEAVIDGRTGRLVPPGDSTALANALLELAADGGLRRDWGTNALEESTRFDITTAVARQQEEYLALVAATR